MISETLKYSVSTSAGTGATATRFVTSVDTTPPNIYLSFNSTNITLNSLTPYLPEVTASDACIGSVTASIKIDNTVNISVPGVYMVTYSVSDASNNLATAVLRVAVIDPRIPVLALNGPNPLVVEACLSLPSDLGAAVATLGLGGDLTSDVQSNYTSLHVDSQGTFFVLYQVKNVQGFTGTAIRKVVIKDTTAPVLTLFGNLTITLEAKQQSFNDPGYAAIDSCDGNITQQVVVESGRLAFGAIGTYTVLYSVRDQAGNIANASRVVIIADTIPPTIILNGNSSMHCEAKRACVDPGCTGVDVYDGPDACNPMQTINTTSFGTFIIQYKSVDASGNVALANRTVVVSDTLPPNITLFGPINMTVAYPPPPFVETGYQAIDLVNGNLTSRIVVNASTMQDGKLGPHFITYTATDNSGNVGIVSRTINVVDNQPPTLFPNQGVLVFAELYVAWTDPWVTVTDNYDAGLSDSAIASFNGTQWGYLGHPIFNQTGVFRVQYTAYDHSGNKGVVSRDVNVTQASPGGSASSAPVVGGVIGAVIVILLILVIIVFLRRTRKPRSVDRLPDELEIIPVIKNLMLNGWYHGDLADTVARLRLKNSEGAYPDGAFLIYAPLPTDDDDQQVGEEYILLLMKEGEIVSRRIMPVGDRLEMDGWSGKADDLRALVTALQEEHNTSGIVLGKGVNRGDAEQLMAHRNSSRDPVKIADGDEGDADTADTDTVKPLTVTAPGIKHPMALASFQGESNPVMMPQVQMLANTMYEPSEQVLPPGIAHPTTLGSYQPQLVPLESNMMYEPYMPMQGYGTPTWQMGYNLQAMGMGMLPGPVISMERNVMYEQSGMISPPNPYQYAPHYYEHVTMEGDVNV